MIAQTSLAFDHLTLAVLAAGVLSLGVLIASLVTLVVVDRARREQAARLDDLVDRLEAAGVIDLSDAELVRQISAAKRALKTRAVG